jgi:hypothetical protein
VSASNVETAAPMRRDSVSPAGVLVAHAARRRFGCHDARHVDL